jgi:hypothetical protein
MTGDLLWAYGVVPAGTTLPATGVGIAGGVVRQVVSGDLAALVSAVPSREFGADPLRDNLNDLTWLERVAREHEAVLEQVLEAATTVPLRLCTIFGDADGVTKMLEREREPLTRGLERLEGRQEWGVKLLVDSDRLAATAAPAGDQALGEGGAAYLARRRHEREAREAARALAVQIVDEVDGSLQAHAIDWVRLPAQNRELSGHTGDMVLNAAYLVEGDAVDQLRGSMNELQQRYAEFGARLELTGPWPPYNFVMGETTTQLA